MIIIIVSTSYIILNLFIIIIFPFENIYFLFVLFFVLIQKQIKVNARNVNKIFTLDFLEKI